MKFLLPFVLMASVAFAHGGTYTGPVGGGQQTHAGPVGGGTGPGQPNPNNPDPGGPAGGGGGHTPPTGGTTGNPHPGGGAPIRPGGGAGPRPSGRGFGGTTGARKKAKNPYLNWQWWWDLNDDRFLLLKKKVRGESAVSDNKDTFLDGLTDEGAVGVSTKVIRDDILPAVMIALEDSYYDTRAAAAIALGKIAESTDDAAFGKLVELLKDNSKQVREAACLGLGLMEHKDSFDVLKSVAESKGKGRKFVGRSQDALLRTRCFALIGVGLAIRNEHDDSTGSLYLSEVATSKAHPRDFRVAATTALQLCPDTGYGPLLFDSFHDEEDDPYVRAHMAVTLGKVNATYSVGTLFEELQNKNDHVSRSSAIALGMLATKEDKKIVKSLRRMVTSGPNRGTKNFSLVSLGEIGSAEGMKSLVNRFSKGTEMDKSFAALAIGIYGFNGSFEDEADKKFVSSLIHKEYIKVKSPSLKGSFALSLGLLNYINSAPDIRKDINKVPQVTQGHLAIALALMEDKDSIPLIQTLVKSRGDVDRRKMASIALGMLGDTSAVELLEQVIKESTSSKSILAAATVSLGHIGDRSSTDTLIDLATGKDHADVSRAFATVALGYLGDKDDIPVLSKIHYNSNYLATTEMLAELLTIL